jgi:hypothetical protein
MAAGASAAAGYGSFILAKRFGRGKSKSTDQGKSGR